MKLDRLSFKHEEWVFRDVAFEVSQGDRLAIFGGQRLR